jgi:hypothetical protein
MSKLLVDEISDADNTGPVTVTDGAVVNRTGDGTIIDLQSGGTSVGRIGTLGSTTYFSGVNSGLRMDTTIVVPTNASGTNLDASLDLGAAGVRFKDLYLSGGVYLGGTGSANKLDDYEEGTWTPIPKRYNDGVGGDITTTGSITVSNSRYTKIGNIVYLYCEINITGTITQGTSDTQIRNIPFLPTKRYNSGAIGLYSALTDNPNDFNGFVADNGYNALTASIANPWVEGYLSISVFYETDA